MGNPYFKIHQLLKGDTLSLLYRSVFTDDFTDSLIELEEMNLMQVEGMKKSRRKVSFLMAESFQNIIRHGLKDSSSVHEYFHLRQIDGRFHINSCNAISNKSVSELQEKLELVNNSTREELKEMHIEILRTGELSEKGGAGIGLIEMARKSGNKLDFKFTPEGDETSLFALGLNLDSIDEPLSDSSGLVESEQIQQLMHDNGWLLVYKGDFSQDSIMPVLSVLEKSVPADDMRSKKMFLVAVELLQNINRHGVVHEGRKEGIFMLGEDGGELTISASNHVTEEDVETLTDSLDRLTTLDDESLTKLYKEAIRSSIGSPISSTGVGLIDVARLTDRRIRYSFEEDGALVFFTLHVNI